MICIGMGSAHALAFAGAFAKRAAAELGLNPKALKTMMQARARKTKHRQTQARTGSRRRAAAARTQDTTTALGLRMRALRLRQLAAGRAP
ncbi:MAG: hypothetical protein IPL34_20530 [Thiofilum sp.]|uniref:hypothetical protein n=1 Tax=Thiofilum sp. TaxID=2212733 RepID=UPI0025F33A3E|nr:hypothetical protein [Thiofilum sp.]MBK8455670.1 hypothetical protein [Thiofilum sp.]